MKKVFTAVLVVLFVAATTSVFAFGRGNGAEGKCDLGVGCQGVRGFGAGMDLTKEQKDAMAQLREKHRAETQALRQELFQKGSELRTVFVDPSATDATILAKQKEVNALRQKMQDKMVQLKLEERRLLTPEQLAKLGEGGKGHGFMKGFGPASGHRRFGHGACGGL